MQTPDKAVSLLTPIGYAKNDTCGYCGKSQSISYYVATKHLTLETYQTLLDRGWRRSGTVLYKPNLLASCCAQYTVRLDSAEFHASKDQRQCINRLNKHILGESHIKETAKRFPLTRDQARKRDTEFDLLERIHESEKVHLKTSPDPSHDPEPAHDLQVTLESDDLTDEKYAIFENYQRVVHHEPPHKISKNGFKRFLCSSPLPRSEPADGGRPHYGSYHQCYRIDGELVAVGVLDLLPHCVSGVYFMYHESVHQHSFGKLGALREIALAKEKGYQYWYPGFYIHSCKKMRYKADFTPQSLLDPESYTWDTLDDALKQKLNEQRYVSLSRERSSMPYPSFTTPINTPIDSDSNTPSDDDDDDNTMSDSSSPDPDQSIPLFARSMPGVLTKEELLEQVDLDSIKVRIRSIDAVTSELVGWAESDLKNPRAMKGIFADLAAALGPEVVRDVVVVFD